jgi:hypothetical protein
MRQRLTLLAVGSIALMGAAEAPQLATRPRHPVLERGERASACVQARLPWNHTCIWLESGGEYRITAEGDWWDAGNKYGPPGGGNPHIKWMEFLRRKPDQPWFKLICALDSRKRELFAYDAEQPYRAKASGELLCFANDVPFFYFNNTGVIQITVERTG